MSKWQPISMSRWHPIETAPKNGTDVLLWESSRKSVLSAYYEESWIDHAFDRPMPSDCVFTHWMLAPKAPPRPE